MRRRKKPIAPPNPAAKSLGSGAFRARVVKSRKAYSRKIKHKANPG